MRISSPYQGFILLSPHGRGRYGLFPSSSLLRPSDAYLFLRYNTHHLVDSSGFHDECIDPLPRRDYNLWRKMDVLKIEKTELPATPDFTMLYYSKNVLEAVEEMCAVGGIGYKVEFTGEGFVFSLYVGVDRTIGQSENDRVIFSEEFENLGQCTYTYDNSNYCNAVLLKGANKGTTGISMYWFDRQEFENCKELCYYEKSEDGSDLSWSTETGQMSDNEYYDKMKQLCKIHMSKAKLQDDLNADIYPNNTGKFDLGDRVSIVNRYGITGSATVLEITETEDETGYRTGGMTYGNKSG